MSINIGYILILMLGFPAGYLLALLARDELVVGRKWFSLLAIVSGIAIVLVIILIKPIKLPVILSLFFVAIISLVAVWKSYDKKFVK